MLRVEEETLSELIERVRDELDPRRRKRAREQMSAAVRATALRAAQTIVSPEDAHDVAQEITSSIESYLLEGDIENPGGYVFRAAQRHAIEVSQRAARRQELAMRQRREPLDETTSEPSAEEKLRAECLREALRDPSLNGRYRDLIQKIDIDEIDIEVLTDELMKEPVNAGKDRDTVRNSQIDRPLSRARRQIALLARKLYQARKRKG